MIPKNGQKRHFSVVSLPAFDIAHTTRCLRFMPGTGFAEKCPKKGVKWVSGLQTDWLINNKRLNPANTTQNTQHSFIFIA